MSKLFHYKTSRERLFLFIDAIREGKFSTVMNQMDLRRKQKQPLSTQTAATKIAGYECSGIGSAQHRWLSQDLIAVSHHINTLFPRTQFMLLQRNQKRRISRRC